MLPFKQLADVTRDVPRPYPMSISNVHIHLVPDATPLLMLGFARSFDCFATQLVASIGLKRSMIAALCTVAVLSALSGLTEWLWLLLLLRTFLGAALSLYQVSRQTHIAATIPNHMRGTASSMLGGSMRIVSVLGPLLGGAVVAAFSVSAAFGLQAVLFLFTAMLVSRAIASPPAASTSAAAASKKQRAGLCVAMRSVDARRALLKASPTALAISLARAARSMILPLRASDAGIGKAGLGGVIAVTFACDTALFPLAGYLMDRCVLPLPYFHMLPKRMSTRQTHDRHPQARSQIRRSAFDGWLRALVCLSRHCSHSGRCVGFVDPDGGEQWAHLRLPAGVHGLRS